MPESPSLIPAEVQQMLRAIFSTQIIESEEIQEALESRGQLHQHRKVAEDFAAAQIEKMLELGADHGLDYHTREVAIETHLPPAPRFWRAWERMTNSLRVYSSIEGGYWLPGGRCALPPPPHESVARDLAAREPLPPPPPPPPPPGLTGAEVERIVAAAIAAAVAKPEETVTDLELTDETGKTKKQVIRSRRRALA